MSNSKLPERASLEYLKKLAKDRLAELRLTNKQTKLAAAQLSVAREHGFSSWREMKAEIERGQRNSAAQFFDACAAGDVQAVKGFAANEPNLIRTTKPGAPHGGWTGLHKSAKQGRAEVVKLLLQLGADPNAPEAGDNTYPLHWAAAQGYVPVVRALLDAGGDPHGHGDVHELDAIGWADGHREVVDLLVERGARHNIFSAMSLGDPTLVRRVVAENPEALHRRLSRFEGGHAALHFAISRKRYDLLDLLIKLGADLESEDMSGHTALAMAIHAP